MASESPAAELARREVAGGRPGAARRSLAYAGRLVVLVAGLYCFAFGIMLTLKSDLGLGPWHVFPQGVSRHTGLSFGTASIAVGFGVLLLSWLLGVRPGVGTVANMVLVGLFIDLIEWSGLLPSFAGHPWPVRLAVNVLGVAVVGFGSALYIKANLGAGPRDSLMLALARRLRGRVALVRGALELAVLVAGYLLGGTAGLGTVVFALGIGPAVGLAFRLLRVRVDGPKGEGRGARGEEQEWGRGGASG